MNTLAGNCQRDSRSPRSRCSPPTRSPPTIRSRCTTNRSPTSSPAWWSGSTLTAPISRSSSCRSTRSAMRSCVTPTASRRAGWSRWVAPAAMAREGITVDGFPRGTVFSVGLVPLRSGQRGGARVEGLFKCPKGKPPAAGMHCDSVEGATSHGDGTARQADRSLEAVGTTHAIPALRVTKGHDEALRSFGKSSVAVVVLVVGAYGLTSSARRRLRRSLGADDAARASAAAGRYRFPSARSTAIRKRTSSAPSRPGTTRPAPRPPAAKPPRT